MSTRDRQPNQIATIARDAPSVWRRRFARACVLSVTATGGAACVLAGLVVAACDNEAETSSDTLDAAPPPPPGACAVGKTATRLCDAAAAPDSGHSDDDGGDAGGAVASDAGGQDAALVAEAPPESENLCLVTEDVTVACPSQLASLETVEGKSGSTDIVLSQVGLGRYASPTNASLVPDDQAHLQHIRVDEKGNGVVVVDPLAPFVANGNAPPHAFGLLGATATSDTQLLFFSKTNEASLSLRSGPLGNGPTALGAPIDVPASIVRQPWVIASPSGEGFFVGPPRSGEFYTPSGPLVIVRGLPDAPRVVTTSVNARNYVARTDPDGRLVVLVHDGTALRLLGGDELQEEQWSLPLELSPSGSHYDVAYVERNGVKVPVVLFSTRDGVGVRYGNSPKEVPSAPLGNSFSTCPRSSYIGITCDACPVDKYCEVGSDSISRARLFTRDNRVFAAFLAGDYRKKMGYARSVVPIIGVGCACTLEERSRSAYADSLVVVEIIDNDAGRAPTVVEWMRVPLYKAGTTGHLAIHPRSDGDVDVTVGARLSTYDAAQLKLPEKPVEYRLLRLSTRLIP